MARLGEILLPGADAAGIVHFVDHHVSVPPADSILMIRYLDWPPPFAALHRGGLATLDAFARTTHGSSFTEVPAEVAHQVVGAIAPEQSQDWQRQLSQLLFFAARSDAVDVVYGTKAGIEALGLPYLAHIEPERRW